MPPYRDPFLGITFVAIDWLISGNPVITWNLSGGPTDHQRVWRNTTDDFYTATDISGSLDPTIVTFTDTTAAITGIEYFYWPISYAAPDEMFAGNSFSVIGWQNQTVGAQSVPDFNDSTGSGIVWTFSPTPAAGGAFRSECSCAYTANMCKNDYQFQIGGNPNVPLNDSVWIEIVSVTGPGPAYGPPTNGIARAKLNTDDPAPTPTTWAIVQRRGSSGVGQVGPGASFVTVPVGGGLVPAYTDPTAVMDVGTGPGAIGIGLLAGDATGPFPGSAEVNFGTVTGITITAKVSYFGPGDTLTLPAPPSTGTSFGEVIG